MCDEQDSGIRLGTSTLQLICRLSDIFLFSSTAPTLIKFPLTSIGPEAVEGLVVAGVRGSLERVRWLQMMKAVKYLQLEI